MGTNSSGPYTLDEIEGDVGHLVHLLDEIMSKILEVDHHPLSSSDSHNLNRAGAFCWIARDIAERIESGFSHALHGDQYRKTTSAIPNSVNEDLPSLYLKWLAVLNQDTTLMTEEEAEASHSVFLDLQNRIIAAETKTPRDLAIQLLADTHEGQSDISETFEKRIREIAALPVLGGATQEAAHA